MYIVMNQGPNRAQRRQAEKQARMSVTASKRKSKTAKRMDRPSRIDAAARGYQKMAALIDRGLSQ